MCESLIAAAFLAGALFAAVPLSLLLWQDHRRSWRLAVLADKQADLTNSYRKDHRDLLHRLHLYCARISSSHTLAGHDFVEGLHAAMRGDDV
jgi:hypothetical protein